MARVVITATADADAAVIIDDLMGKAGANVAGRYDADFDAFYRRHCEAAVGRRSNLVRHEIASLRSQ